MEEEKTYVSVPEAAEMLGLKRNRVWVLCREGRFKGAFKVGDVWAIPKDSVLGVVRYGSRGKGKLAAERAAILEQAKGDHR
jgi:predicted DNA-binding transcriptional regulator AlpA